MDRTVLTPSEGYYGEKKSEFFAVLAPCETQEEARALVEAQRRKRPDARHHCFAWRLADGSERAADDGEPQGTAGQPILDVLRKKQYTRCVLIVTRVFGGILLGASGLQRAYRAAAASAAAAVTDEVMIAPCRRLSFLCPYALFPSVRRFLEGADCRMEPPVFDQFVTLKIAAGPDEADRILAGLQELTAGKLKDEPGGSRVTDEEVACIADEAGEELLPTV